MKHFRVTMIECRDGKVRKIVQEAYCESRAQVVEFYGLNEPDIFSYQIEEL